MVGEAQSGREALQLLAALAYGVVFLDIEMPGLDGVSLAERIAAGDYGSPLVVFVTAHDRHAVPAFDVEAVDYIPKPLDPRRVAATTDRLLLRRQGTAAAGRWSPCSSRRALLPGAMARRPFRCRSTRSPT